MLKPKSPVEVYRAIREVDHRTIGGHWDGVGVYLGDGVWGDPEAGEYEFEHQAALIAPWASRGVPATPDDPPEGNQRPSSPDRLRDHVR